MMETQVNLPSKGNAIVTQLSVINFTVPLNMPLATASDHNFQFKLHPKRKKIVRQKNYFRTF